MSGIIKLASVYDESEFNITGGLEKSSAVINYYIANILHRTRIDHLDQPYVTRDKEYPTPEAPSEGIFKYNLTRTPNS